jgi:hypothetical protein
LSAVLTGVGECVVERSDHLVAIRDSEGAIGAEVVLYVNGDGDDTFG